MGGDHRFLTERGWKYITGTAQGRLRRPHLTTGNKLMGTGAFTRKRAIEGQAVKSAAKLNVVAIEPLGADAALFDMTTGTGDYVANGVVSHNCYARPYHEYLGLSAGIDFETKIMVKEDAPKLLRKELASPRWQPQMLGLSGVTDAYQPIERHLLLTRRCLEVLVEFRNPVAIVTKNHLITRDIDLLRSARRAQRGPRVYLGDNARRHARRPHGAAPPAPRGRLDAIRASARPAFRSWCWWRRSFRG